MGKQLAPDDDPRFEQWIKTIGPLEEMPPEPVTEPGSAIAAALALLAATVGMGAALGMALALVIGAVTVVLAMLLIGGGAIVALAALTYLVVRAI
jgi:hypothetical protein